MVASAIVVIGVIRFRMLAELGYRAVLIDSRGHGRSTRYLRPLNI